MEYCAATIPAYKPLSVSGYHIREAGSTAAQELAFTLADGFGYVELGLSRGMHVDTGVEPTRQDGCHGLRHIFASVLLDAGESIKVVSEYLGHSDPRFTLRTYTHVMPHARARSLRAIDAVFAAECATKVPSGRRA
jgi:Methylmalonyl-CoA mutase/Phage integrase family